jgi:uncharacterized membrane protein
MGVAFLDSFFSPFFLASFIMIGAASAVSYYASGKRGFNSNAFGITVLVFLICYTAINVYPFWAGFVLIIAVGVWIAKTFGVIGSK